jgi:hypothetical protein
LTHQVEPVRALAKAICNDSEVPLDLLTRLLSQPSLKAARRRRWRSTSDMYNDFAINQIDSVS